MGRRISVIVDGRQQVLWGEAGKYRDQENSRAGDPQNPATDIPEEGHIVVTQHQPNSAEERHHACERAHWRSQRRLAWCLNIITIVTIGIGITGLYYIGATWKETRRQADAATDALKEARAATKAAVDQAATADRTFKATQRAAVYMGLPDGKFMDLTLEGDQQQIVVHLRNYGTTTARNLLVELLPVTLSPDNPSLLVEFSPFLGEQVTRIKMRGPDLPPGFPYAYRWPYVGSTRDLLDQKYSALRVIGRIIYFDEFGYRCETFTTNYESDVHAFKLRGKRPLCEEKPQRILFCYDKAAISEVELGEDDTVEYGCIEGGISVKKVK